MFEEKSLTPGNGIFPELENRLEEDSLNFISK